MTRIIEKDGKWYDDNGNYVGITVSLPACKFAIRTSSGDIKPLRLGWVDQFGDFYDLCCLPYSVCIHHCNFFKTKVCRFSPSMRDEGYYVID